MSKKLAIVAALEREVAPLVRDWDLAIVRIGERELHIRERDGVMVTWGGIGAAAARTAAEVLHKHAKGELAGFISAGYAGALTPELKVGDVVQPAQVVTPEGAQHPAQGKNATDGTLVSSISIASAEAKQELAIQHSAKAVDMEAHAVADYASVHRIPCVVIKVISDEHDSELPPVNRFIDAAGRFKSSSFAVHALVRPWLWRKVIRLGRDTSLASRALCDALREAIAAHARGELYNKGTGSPR
jgi:adenosylhomocysteine nucleosidase